MVDAIKGLFGFGGPKIPKPPKPLSPPDITQASKDAEQQALGRKGRLAGLVTGPSGSGLPNTAVSKLFGN